MTDCSLHQLKLYYTFLHIGCAIEPLVTGMFLVLTVVYGNRNGKDCYY